MRVCTAAGGVRAPCLGLFRETPGLTRESAHPSYSKVTEEETSKHRVDSIRPLRPSLPNRAREVPGAPGVPSRTLLLRAQADRRKNKNMCVCVCVCVYMYKARNGDFSDAGALAVLAIIRFSPPLGGAADLARGFARRGSALSVVIKESYSIRGSALARIQLHGRSR